MKTNSSFLFCYILADVFTSAFFMYNVGYLLLCMYINYKSTMNTLTIISCSNKKRDYACRADEMYIGPFFTKLYNLAKRIGGDIYISSAWYGLIKPDTIIEPYDFGIWPPYEDKLVQKGIISPETRKSMSRKRRKWRNPIVENVYKCKLTQSGITNENYDVCYVGVSEYYIKPLEEIVLKQPYKNLTLGSGGMFGLRGDYLKNQLNKLNELPLGFRKEHL